MAVLHADFGSYEEALAAMHETVAIARENKDMTCVNFCVSWLYYYRTIYCRQRGLGGHQPLLGSNEETLAFLKEKANQEKLWNILSSALLNEAELDVAMVGDSWS